MFQNRINSEEYPFQHQFFEHKMQQLHFVDEGEGPAIIFVHGTPTWSFLYRHHIKALSQNYRCIAMDNLGFGLSQKEGTQATSIKEHSENLMALVDHLGLKDFHLVVHDFGGPIGLGMALRYPEKVKSITLFNTWLWATNMDPKVQKVDKFLKGPFGKWLYLVLNFSVKVLLKMGFSDKKKLSKSAYQHYTMPFPTKASRLSLYQIGLNLFGASDWYNQLNEQLAVLDHCPFLVLWGQKDQFIDLEALQRWKNTLVHKEVHLLDCGHFVQEEQPKQSIQLLERFLLRLNQISTPSVEHENNKYEDRNMV